MKNLLLVLLFVLPLALYSASPSCVAGSEVSLIDANGKVFKTGKFDNRGQLTLDGLDDAVYTIRLTKNGKSCNLDKPTAGNFSGLPTGKRMHKPITFKISDQQGGGNLLLASTEKESGRSTGNVTPIDDWTKTSKKKQNNGVDQDCDDIEFSVISVGGGKVNFQDITLTK
ncbi:MAG: hypothetical protein CVV25_03575 [Ignavibacteriae bacterium HGW-Ignavibacteriae-4]|nr:MAG: hypothetical protein CVV25_03575 [Ignavibacteriae bacterium HGW-Ignavibacteriae-4]